jgi:4'-phosphopantetheinyl transferase
VKSWRQDAIYVWRLDLPAAFPVSRQLSGILSQSEQQRADKFRFDNDRLKFVAAHAALREILSVYLNLEPARIEFSEGPQGKPEVVLGADEAPLRFNLSHSHDSALVAITYGRSVGIDIEYVQPSFEWRDIASRFFARREVEKLQSLRPEEQRRGFFTCWTRKEAYIKAKGGGLSIPLEDFEVAFAPGEPPALLWHRTDPEETHRWQFDDVEAPGYAAAVAAEGRGSALEFFSWPDDVGRV